jgi:hypothetical protein
VTAVGDPGAAVVPGDGEALVAERAHHRDDVAAHRAVGVGLVVRRRGRAAGRAVAAQVRADDGVAAREQRRHAMPGGVRARMPVQEDHGRPVAAVAHADRRLVSVDALQREPVEEHGSDIHDS